MLNLTLFSKKECFDKDQREEQSAPLGGNMVKKKKLTKTQIKKRNALAEKMKDHKEIETPYALATYMAKKGCKVHKRKRAR